MPGHAVDGLQRYLSLSGHRLDRLSGNDRRLTGTEVPRGRRSVGDVHALVDHETGRRNRDRYPGGSQLLSYRIGECDQVHASGEGLLVQDLGRIVRDLTTGDIISLASRWMLLEGDTTAVCAYFTDV